MATKAAKQMSFLRELGVPTTKYDALLERLRRESKTAEHPLARGKLRRQVVFAIAFVGCQGNWRAAANQTGVAPTTVATDWFKDETFRDELREAWQEIWDGLQVALTEQALKRALDPKAKSDKALFEVLGAMNPQVWDPRVRAAKEMAKAPQTKLFVHISARDLQEVKALDPAFIDITALENRANDQGSLPQTAELRSIEVCQPSEGQSPLRLPEGSGDDED